MQTSNLQNIDNLIDENKASEQQLDNIFHPLTQAYDSLKLNSVLAIITGDSFSMPLDQKFSFTKKDIASMFEGISPNEQQELMKTLGEFGINNKTTYPFVIDYIALIQIVNKVCNNSLLNKKCTKNVINITEKKINENKEKRKKISSRFFLISLLLSLGSGALGIYCYFLPIVPTALKAILITFAILLSLKTAYEYSKKSIKRTQKQNMAPLISAMVNQIPNTKQNAKYKIIANSSQNNKTLPTNPKNIIDNINKTEQIKNAIEKNTNKENVIPNKIIKPKEMDTKEEKKDLKNQQSILDMFKKNENIKNDEKEIQDNNNVETKNKKTDFSNKIVASEENNISEQSSSEESSDVDYDKKKQKNDKNRSIIKKPFRITKNQFSSEEEVSEQSSSEESSDVDYDKKKQKNKKKKLSNLRDIEASKWKKKNKNKLSSRY